MNILPPAGGDPISENPKGALPGGMAGGMIGVWNEQLNSSTAAASASSSLVNDGLNDGDAATELLTPETVLPARGRGRGR